MHIFKIQILSECDPACTKKKQLKFYLWFYVENSKLFSWVFTGRVMNWVNDEVIYTVLCRNLKHRNILHNTNFVIDGYYLHYN